MSVNPSDFRAWAYTVGRDLLATVPGQRFELDDLVQEALITIWQAAPHWANDGRASLATYVTAAARRRMQEIVWRDRPALGEGDRHRTHGSRHPARGVDSLDALVEKLESDGTPYPDALVAQDDDRDAFEVRDAVRAAVAALPDGERQAVTAMDLGGMSASEATAVVGKSKSRVLQLRRDGHARLRPMLSRLVAA